MIVIMTTLRNHHESSYGSKFSLLPRGQRKRASRFGRCGQGAPEQAMNRASSTPRRITQYVKCGPPCKHRIMRLGWRLTCLP